MAAIFTWIMANLPMVFGILFALSELLAYIPAIKANSICQLLFGWIKKGHDQWPEIKK